MAELDLIHEQGAAVPVAAGSDVLVVGGGPAGQAAAIAARRMGVSVTLVERYPYLGGLASGGMVLVLDDMTNGPEITVTGICMEMIERMQRIGAAVYPPPEDRRQSEEMWRKWARWGVHDFRSTSKPLPIVMAAAFDPDGWKRVANDMIAEAGVNLRLHSWFSKAIVEGDRIKGVICETKEGRQALLGDVVVDTSGDLDVAASAGARFTEGGYMVTTVFRLGGVDTDAAERFRWSEPEAYARSDKQARSIIGGSWDMWGGEKAPPGGGWWEFPPHNRPHGTQVGGHTKSRLWVRKPSSPALHHD